MGKKKTFGCAAKEVRFTMEADVTLVLAAC